MKKRLLILSNSTNYGEKNYLTFGRGHIQEFLKDVNGAEVLFFPYAAVGFSYDEYTEKVSKVLSDKGIKIKSIHKTKEPVKALQSAKALMVGGGNTFHLLKELYEKNLMYLMREKIFEGIPYVGWSAGANIVSPSIKTTNDMPIVEPSSFNALDIVPFQINPHYTEQTIPNFAGESRIQRIEEFISLNPDTYVVAMPEGCAVRVINRGIKVLTPKKKIKLYKKGIETKEYGHKDDLTFLL